MKHCASSRPASTASCELRGSVTSGTGGRRGRPVELELRLPVSPESHEQTSRAASAGSASTQTDHREMSEAD